MIKKQNFLIFSSPPPDEAGRLILGDVIIDGATGGDNVVVRDRGGDGVIVGDGGDVGVVVVVVGGGSGDGAVVGVGGVDKLGDASLADFETRNNHDYDHTDFTDFDGRYTPSLN
ncbi:hypothetical protein FXO38_12935 [Capsicum annuum]|nr:hypothetical protein FXO38_12935 [Capsicum annuum]